jgi:hypothetical protein
MHPSPKIVAASLLLCCLTTLACCQITWQPPNPPQVEWLRELPDAAADLSSTDQKQVIESASQKDVADTASAPPAEDRNK